MVKRYVLTGGPCCGKTSLIEELADRGYTVVPEVARDVLKNGNYACFEDRQEGIFKEQLRYEEEVSKEVIFCDRGIIDSLAYAKKYLGFVSNNLQLLASANDVNNRYYRVFLLEQLPFESDGVRIESSEEEARELHEHVKKMYEEFGYYLEDVPIMSVDERADYIISKVGGEDDY